MPSWPDQLYFGCAEGRGLFAKCERVSLTYLNLEFFFFLVCGKNVEHEV